MEGVETIVERRTFKFYQNERYFTLNSATFVTSSVVVLVCYRTSSINDELRLSDLTLKLGIHPGPEAVSMEPARTEPGLRTRP